MSDTIRTDPDILHGTPCFAGTRVPVRILFDYLEAGDTVSDFLDQYPTVTREQAEAVLREAADRVTEPPRAAG